MSHIDLSNIPSEDLIAALRERPDIFVFTLDLDMVSRVILNDEDCELTEEQLTSASIALLAEEGKRLKDHLVGHSEDYLNDAWANVGFQIEQTVTAGLTP